MKEATANSKQKPFRQRSKLGANVINSLMANNASLPEVGKGATVLYPNDRHAYEVLEVSEDKRNVTIQQYKAERTDNNGQSESQTYKYETLLDGTVKKILWRNGAWRVPTAEIVFEDAYYKEYEAQPDRQKAYKEMIEPLFSGGKLSFVEGKTKIKMSYPKIRILFGVKDEFYDYSF